MCEIDKEKVKNTTRTTRVLEKKKKENWGPIVYSLTQ